MNIHSLIKERAYFIWLNTGNCDNEHNWFEAERQINAEMNNLMDCDNEHNRFEAECQLNNLMDSVR